MKKKILCLSLGLFLCACSSISGGDYSSETSGSDGTDEFSSSKEVSSSLDGDFDMWEEDEKALMMTYCGSLLPHPYDLVGAGIQMEEQENNGDKCLVLFNSAEEWTLKDYYKMLQNFGWTCISGYDGNLIQTKGGSSYVELTKEGEDGKAYELMYCHVDNSESGGDSYNCIVCYSSFVSTKTDKTGWSKEEKEAISYVTSSSLPFFALGSDYAFSMASETELDFFDYCSKDLSNEIIASLRENGFESDEEKSKEYECFCLGKTLSDGAKIEILINYFRGNNVYIYFTPAMEESSSWPSAFLEEAEKASGISVPSFKIAKGGSYKTYVLHEVSYVVTYDLSSTFDYYSYIENINSELFSWEEKLSISAYLLADDSGEEVGFMLSFKLSEPSSVFVSSWPSETIEQSLKDCLNVEGVEIPSLDLSSFKLSKPMKYNVVTQKEYDETYEYYLSLYKQNYGDSYSLATLEEMAKTYTDKKIKKGITLSFYDSALDDPEDFALRYKVNEAYKKLLYSSGWYLVPDTGETEYEDSTGKVRISVSNSAYSNSYGYTCIVIGEGSGEAHVPTLKYRQDTYEIGTGHSYSPVLDVSMLPYEISYSCSDSTGKVSVDSSTGVVNVSVDAPIGETYELFATCEDDKGNTYLAKTTIKIVKGVNYSTNLEEVETLLKEQGYTDYTVENMYVWGSSTKVNGRKLTVNFGTSMTKKEVKDLVENHLVPESFVSGMWGSEEEYLYSASLSANNPLKSFPKGAAKTSDKEYLHCFRMEDYASFSLTYYVYTESDGSIVLYVESQRYR